MTDHTTAASLSIELAASPAPVNRTNRHERSRGWSSFEKTLLVSATIFIGGVTVLPLLLYAFWFYFVQKFPLSTSPEVWGQFGDYFGGVINPILGFISTVGVLATIYYQRLLLSQSFEQIADLQNKESKEELVKVLQTIDEKIEALLQRKIQHWKLHQISSPLQDQIAEPKSPDESRDLKTIHAGPLSSLNDELKVFSRFLCQLKDHSSIYYSYYESKYQCVTSLLQEH